MNNKENQLTVLEHLDAYRQMRAEQQKQNEKYWKEYWNKEAKKHTKPKKQLDN